MGLALLCPRPASGAFFPRGGSVPAMRAAPRLMTLASVLLAVASLAFIAAHLKSTPVTADGQRYQEMALSFLHTGEFHADTMTLAHPQVGESENGYTHYFSPLWPIVQAGFYALFGPFGFWLAFMACCAAALVAAWWCTRNLYGDALATAAVGFTGYYLYGEGTVGQRSAEPLAMVFFLVMMWAIQRSIRPGQGKWILLAGAAAGLAYLTRSSIGWLFILGGAAGFAWRLYHHRKGALNKHYLGAILIFGACYGLWALRNLWHFWDGTLGDLPSAMTADAVFQHKLGVALAQPLKFVETFPLKIAWAGFLLWPVWLLRHSSLFWQLRNLRNEEQSGLFLSWAVPFFLGALAGTVSTLGDTDPPPVLFNIDNIRYFLFAMPGLLWNPLPLGAWEPTPPVQERDLKR